MRGDCGVKSVAKECQERWGKDGGRKREGGEMDEGGRVLLR